LDPEAISFDEGVCNLDKLPHDGDDDVASFLVSGSCSIALIGNQKSQAFALKTIQTLQY
jgi:hypothetical protein